MKPDDSLLKLQRLRDAAERVSANLVELEIDSGRQLLEASPLQGKSAASWSRASEALTELWRRHGLLEGLVERAQKRQGSRQADELRSLLEGPSIELSSSEVPLAERDLLGSSRVANRRSPDELLAGMSAAFDEVKTVVARIGEAWEMLIPKLDAARRLLQVTSQLAEEVGESGRGDLKFASQTLDTLSAAITTDPLSIATDDVDSLSRSLQAIRADLESSIALARGFDKRMLEGRELLDRLRVAVQEVQAAHEELRARISVPAAPPAPATPDGLETELAAIVELGQRGAWRESRQALDDWAARTNTLLEAARQALDANRAPIDARNQLRALLDAYQVKAKRLGLLEDPRLAGIFARAQEALHNAPTDLGLAAQLVRSYQQAVSGFQPIPETML